jgi:putative ABC transport system permease protein
MKLTQILIEALESLTSNKMRSGLTILGIVIGVAAVIAMLAIGAGAQNSITGSINGIGTNVLFVFSGNRQIDVKNIRPLTMKDAEAISDPFTAPSVAAVAPILQGSVEAAAGGEKTNITVSGVTDTFARVRSETMTEGDFISADQVLGQASVALIGPETADKLFGRHEGLVGENIRLAGQPFRIIGILASKGGSAMGSEDNRILVPLSTARTRLFQRSGDDTVDLIFAETTSADTTTQAADEIKQILQMRHRTAIGQDDFTVFSQADMLSVASSITGVLTIFLGGIAAISLLVGGIGIMNIMLVSVAERTREIGLRKALGARKNDILIQFLAESSLLSLFGGLVGIALGWTLSVVVGLIAAANKVDFNPAITMNAVLMATLFSAAVGLFFGIYPANRAASLQPVEALRYE